MIRSTFNLLLLAAPTLLAAQDTFYAAYSPDNSDGMIVTVDLATGAESNELPVSLNGTQVDGLTGMAIDPTSGEVYVVTKVSSTFTLGTIDLSTGVVTEQAVLQDKISSIAIGNDGVIYGITGDGADIPETLYTIDPSDGSFALVTTPGTGSDGEALAFNSDNGLLYRYGGAMVFQSIDPADGTVVDIGLSGPVANYAHALTYTNGMFVFAAGDTFYELDTEGTLTTGAEIVSSGGYKGLLDADLLTTVSEQRIEAPVMFPNPATEQVEITVPEGEIELLRIHDASGALIVDQRLNKTNRHIQPVDQWPAGVYTVETRSGNTVRRGSFTVIR